MAKHFFHGKRRGAVVALSVALSATLSLGIFAACAGANETPSDEGTTPDTETSSAPDSQLLKNGNFEFYSEETKAVEDKRAFINSPTNWRATAGSGSYASLTASGIVNVDEWTSISKSSHSLVPDSALTEIAESSFKAKDLTDEVISNATEHWEEASVYDRLLFYKYYGVTSKDQFAPYGDYTYSIDFEDVQYLSEDLGDSISVGSSTADEDDKNVLMIHNRQRYQSGNHKMHGAAQYYTSSTTISLEAGTAATITVDVRTSNLQWGYVDEEGTFDNVTAERGAYIGITNTVGGQSQPEMQIKNINTNGEWQTYTIYIRANTFATTSFAVKLGLGQGNTDDRYELVDGYAFFDNVTVKKFLGTEYEERTQSIDDGFKCNINTPSEEKIFSRDGVDKNRTTYALNLLSEDDSGSGKSLSPIERETLQQGFENNIGITTEAGTSKPYESLIKDNRDDGTTPENRRSIVELTTYADLEGAKETNEYLTTIFGQGFEKFPFKDAEGGKNVPVLMMLSTNGAAYTATLKGDESDENNIFLLPANSRKLISFFVKTSEIDTGCLGAGITLVDGDNETSIASFDSTDVPAVDVDDDLKDIYEGWVQCFFIVANETDSAKSFSLKFTYGVTSVQGTTENDYCNGYAAFTDFRMMDLNKTEYSFASTGSYAKKVSLTSIKADTSRFDTADAASDIEKDLANPSSFREAVAGQNVYAPDPDEDQTVYAGLINNDKEETVTKYQSTPWGEWLTNNVLNGQTDEWWNKLFGEKSLIDPSLRSQREARQPLVLINTGADTASHGFILRSLTASISANSYYKISMRVKVSVGATAYLYLIDMDDTDNGYNQLIAPSVPKVTYWYDDDGNILRCDPESDGFDKTSDILYYRETNGLYTAVADAEKTNKTYYANLYNYDRDDDNNYVTDDGTIAFYWHENKVYGHYDEAAGTYSQEVHNLPTSDADGNSILRYDNRGLETSKYQSVISVTGTPENQDQWITVSFYVHTGNKAKNYRVELWAGNRSNTTDGFPAGSYVFFDGYSTGTTSDFETNRNAAVESLKHDADLGDDDNLGDAIAKYYTFTFFDSASYLRHDRDFDGADYDKWQNYKQSSYSEGLLWLQYFDENGKLAVNGEEDISVNPSYALFLDFSLIDQAVSEYTPADNETPDEEPEEEEPSDTNIWLVLSSSILAVVTVLAVAAVVFRAVRKKVKKNAPVKIKEKKSRRVKVESAPAKPEVEEPKPETKNENDPYND